MKALQSTSTNSNNVLYQSETLQYQLLLVILQLYFKLHQEDSDDIMMSHIHVFQQSEEAQEPRTAKQHSAVRLSVNWLQRHVIM